MQGSREGSARVDGRREGQAGEAVEKERGVMDDLRTYVVTSDELLGWVRGSQKLCGSWRGAWCYIGGVAQKRCEGLLYGMSIYRFFSIMCYFRNPRTPKNRYTGKNYLENLNYSCMYYVYENQTSHRIAYM